LFFLKIRENYWKFFNAGDDIVTKDDLCLAIWEQPNLSMKMPCKLIDPVEKTMTSLKCGKK